jgi:predicted phage terminase large subunit-like protein
MSSLSYPLQLEQLPFPPNSPEEFTRAGAVLKLATFAETFYPGWLAGDFHELLAGKLEDCFRRKIRRLAISVPPQHGKSRLASVNFPAWAMTKAPRMRFFQAGHSGDLSRGFTREARAIVNSPRYRQIFPALINPEVSRQDYWETAIGGYYYATSVGGGTGMPADVLIVDDPHRDRSEANKKGQRDRVWDWFTSTATTRLAPDGVIIVIQTRWHIDDLIGRLTDPRRVRQMEDAGFPDMNFEVLSLEAICEDEAKDMLKRKVGEALWPEVRDVRKLLVTKEEIGTSEWNSLYQQRPNPPGGAYIDTRKIKFIRRELVPAGVEMKRGWDLAVADHTMGDYNAGAFGGLDNEGNMYLQHVDRAKRRWNDQRQVIINYAEREAIGGEIGIEAVGAFLIAVEEIRKHFNGRLIVRSFSPSKSKLTRALQWFAKIDAGKFYLVEGDWNQDFIDELEQFPNGIYDDQIDAVSILWDLFLKRDNFVFA